MRRTIADTAVPLPIPNPHEWVGRTAAMRLLDVLSHVTLSRMVDNGLLTAYRIDGGPVLYWRAQVVELAEARKRAGLVAR